MPCAYPMWRMDFEKARHLYELPSAFDKRQHNGGIIMSKEEAAYYKQLYPLLSPTLVQVPCGKCISCRLSYSRDWANRCMSELKTNPLAFFLTLTYDDTHLMFAPFVDAEDGTVSMRPCLVPSDFTKFMKRLRIYCQREGIADEIRFFGCGEYGDDSERPHYHIIIYGFTPPEQGRHIWRQPSADAPVLWTHKMFEELWTYGLSCYGDVTWESCAYVARYCMKKRKGLDRAAQKAAQESFGFPPWPEEFVRMSRRPGLGRDFYERNKDTIYMTDEMFVPVKGSISSVKPARYFDRLYDLEYPDRMHDIKLKRQRCADLSMRSILQRTDLTEEEYLEQLAAAKLDQSRRLVRPEI